ALQRTPPLPSERAQALFTRHQEQGPETKSRRVAHPVRRSEFPRWRQGNELASGARGIFLPVHSRVLGKVRHSGRFLEAPRSEQALNRSPRAADAVIETPLLGTEIAVLELRKCWAQPDRPLADPTQWRIRLRTRSVTPAPQ